MKLKKHFLLFSILKTIVLVFLPKTESWEEHLFFFLLEIFSDIKNVF